MPTFSVDKVLNLTYERAKRGALTNIILDVIHDEQASIRDRIACMRIWHKTVDHSKWNQEEVETVLGPIIERRNQVMGSARIPPRGRPVLLVIKNKKKD